MNHSRREFLKQSVLITVCLPSLGAVSRGFISSAVAAEVPLPAGQTKVPETDPVALAIGYKENVKDVDYVKYPQRKKPAAKKQFCDNCVQYTAVNQGWGSCQMLTSGVVSSKGWCGSWSPKSE